MTTYLLVILYPSIWDESRRHDGAPNCEVVRRRPKTGGNEHNYVTTSSQLIICGSSVVWLPLDDAVFGVKPKK